ncbi:nuclear transport factor 2 family protein [Streptomyces sp. NPDC088116]|uniref:nuclear transport factor 2 family protein n=1 Tax=Streptomyces sp. NPDC088116 TaxID=3365825 RepID=UPI0038234AD5
MSTVADFVERYTDLWNESDPDRRRKAVGELWTSDGHYANVNREFLGHAQVLEAIDEAYEDFIVKGFVFTAHEYVENHGALRITWHMVPAGGGDVAAVGTEYIVRDKDGLIVTDYQFMVMEPAA